MSQASDVVPGDIVAVNVPTGQTVRKEGLVVGTHYDHTGRQILEIQFDRGEYIHAPRSHVQKVRRTTYYNYAALPAVTRRYIERYVDW